MADLEFERQKQSAIVLANASDIIAGVVKEIAGNDISSSLNGSAISNELIQTLAHQRIGKQLEQSLQA